MTPSLLDLHARPENATDKGNATHSFAGRSYLHHYERHFSPLRFTATRILEIGVHGGFSLRLWRDYFPAATIHGLDINPDALTNVNGEPRIIPHLGDQSSPETLASLASLGPFDAIIDDGSHCTAHLLASLAALWPSLKPGGLYVLEDMSCSYISTADPAWPGMSLNPTIPPNDRSQVDALLLSSIRTMDHLRGDIAAIHIYPMVYFLEKALLLT